MRLTVDELVDKAVDQRRRGRYEEALVSAIAATEQDAKNADAWWQIALNQWALGEARLAVPALERTVELAPHFAPAWARLGSARLNTDNKAGALEAFKAAFVVDAGIEEAIRGIVEILDFYQRNDPDKADPELFLTALTRLDEISNITSYHLNLAGIFHYRMKNFLGAIKYWRRANDRASLSNLGLVYNDPDVAQTADAIDMWRLSLARFPDYKWPQNRLAEALPQALTQAKAARRINKKRLLPEDQWYVNYLNPLELLNCPRDIALRDLNGKVLKSFKDKLLKEIELEDGVVSWIPGVRIDKSKAISTSDELNDAIKREYHWYVFRDYPLLDFLSRGGFEHFLVDETKASIETLELVYDEVAQFRQWLSEPFAKQYDLVLSKAIDLKNPALISCLLSGRRWVTPSFADKCFQNTLRQVDRLLQPLRDAAEQVGQAKPSAASVKALLDQDLLLYLLNVLPIYFQQYRDEAIQLVREIAGNSYAKHSDIDLAKAILEISNGFRKISINLRGCIEEDFKQIEKIILKERESEARLTLGGNKWEITKHGALLGSERIPAEKVASLRWGTFIRRQANGSATYDFLLTVKDTSGLELRYGWQTSCEIEKSEKHFGQLVKAAFNHLFPAIFERIDALLKKGTTVRIGPCVVTDDGVSFETQGWFLKNTNTVPWHRLGINVANGDLTVFDTASPKIKTTMGLRDTENAIVLRCLAQARQQSKE